MVVKLKKEMCVDKLYQPFVTSTHGLFLRQAVSSLAGLSAVVGGEEKEREKQGSGEGLGKCGPGSPQPLSQYPPSH